MTDHAALWHSTIDKAMALPHTPTEIAAVIIRTSDTGLRAARYDGAGGRTDIPRPTEDAALNRHEGRQRDDQADLAPLNEASIRFVAAVGVVTEFCSGARPPETWDEAVKDAHLLSPGVLKAGIDVDHDQLVRNAILESRKAVEDVERIHDRHCAHEASEHVKVSQGTYCRSCLRIDVHKERATLMCCRSCYRDIEDLQAGGLGEATDLQRDPAMWPSVGMIRARHEQRRIRLDKERDAWLRSHGLNPAIIASRRRVKRHGPPSTQAG